ncbi:MAG: heavy metal translocating P-type ATPase [Eubacterium sp.]|nr:heavy metal translocating P-type ATPase [Eubacterium sp.]
MKQFTVTGMSCAACQARVEKAVNKVNGVKSCSVSLLTNSMGVEGDVDDETIIKAVKNAGYDAKSASGSTNDSAYKSKTASNSVDEIGTIQKNEITHLKKRLISSVVFLIILMYITMGHNMAGFPVPSFLSHNHIGLAITQMLLSLIVMVINRDFFINGFKSAIRLSPNMDTLVALGATASFGWSIFILYKMTWMITNGASNASLMDIYHNQLFFESAAMIPALITIGKLLEAISKGRTTNALKSLMKLAPKTAVLIIDNEEVRVDIDEVVPGDVFVVKPGQIIPVDGVVLEGTGAVNESALTGESIPVDKNAGDVVSAATVNMSGVIRCKATRVGEDTTLAGIIKIVSQSAATKAPIARIADRVSAVFVPVVLLLALIVLFGWLIAGENVSYALARAISVLVISCPCALGLATPVAIMVGNGIGAKHGILFKTGEALEMTGKIKNIVLDKTGTITSGVPTVTDVFPFDEFSEKYLLVRAYALENNSVHPLAKAIVNHCENAGVRLMDVTDFEEVPGNGLSAVLNEKTIHSGNSDYIKKFIINDDEEGTASPQDKADEIADRFSSDGKTPIFIEEDGGILGVIAIADTIRDSSALAVDKLKDLGKDVYMLTGDNVNTAVSIGNKVGIKNVIAGVLPDEKEKNIEKISKSGKTAMVGDGINDAPALTTADVGIAIGTGTEVAVDSADVVLMNDDLNDVVKATVLGKKTIRNIHENLFWAFFYNAICIPLAAGLFGIELNPMIAAAAMSLSSVTVCLNALRLNLLKL